MIFFFYLNLSVFRQTIKLRLVEFNVQSFALSSQVIGERLYLIEMF